MHELSLVEGIFQAIELQKQKHDFKKVLSVEIMCGKLNHHIKEHLEFCFEAMAKSPLLSGAKITVNQSDSINDDGIYLDKLEVA
jgi:Zn finger protein HypA/HybF involved in hydrogenase expression